MFGKLCDRSCSAKQPGGDRIATPTRADEMMSCQINHVGRKTTQREESLRIPVEKPSEQDEWRNCELDLHTKSPRQNEKAAWCTVQCVCAEHWHCSSTYSNRAEYRKDIDLTSARTSC